MTQDNTPALLSLEQEFLLRQYQAQLKAISRDDLEDLFLGLMRQKMAQENVFKDLMRGSWTGLAQDHNCGGR